jgi:hypothetical protein
MDFNLRRDRGQLNLEIPTEAPPNQHHTGGHFASLNSSDEAAGDQTGFGLFADSRWSAGRRRAGRSGKNRENSRDRAARLRGRG